MTESIFVETTKIFLKEGITQSRSKVNRTCYFLKRQLSTSLLTRRNSSSFYPFLGLLFFAPVSSLVKGTSRDVLACQTFSSIYELASQWHLIPVLHANELWNEFMTFFETSLLVENLHRERHVYTSVLLNTKYAFFNFEKLEHCALFSFVS